LPGTEVIAEARARHSLDLPSGGRVMLTGKADRIEIGADGAARIVDYKSGTPPVWSAIAEGKSPQLTLTARLVELGAFAGVPSRMSVESIAYLPIGGRQPVVPVHAEKTAAEFGPLAKDILPRLMEKLDALARGAEAYDATLRAKRGRGEEGEYDHFARVAEWSIIAAADEAGDEP
jgi:ATP-dependent helicase/nuclease subunit B